MTQPPGEQPDVYRITTATTGRSDDQDKRIAKYLLSMLVRTICVVLVIVVPGPLRYVFAVGAIFLPYIAVVIANASGQRRDPDLPTVDPTTPSALTDQAAAPAAADSVATMHPSSTGATTLSGDFLVGEVVEERREPVAGL